MSTHGYLDKGIYSVAEASRLTGISTQKLGYWFFNESHNALDADFQPVNGQKSLSFFDLIESLTVQDLRQRGVSLAVIKEGHEQLKRNLGTDHPFCHESIFTDGRALHIIVENSDREKFVQEVRTGQNSSHVVVSQYLDEIEFDDLTRIAKQWNIFAGITINPRVSLGKPVIARSRIPSWVVYDAYRANSENTALVSSLYEINEDDVLNAVAFETGLLEKGAA